MVIGGDGRPAEEVSYGGRTAALATRHGKGSLIAPALAAVGLEVVVADVDTDSFGTFSGETPRRDSPLVTAELKARAAMALTGVDAGLASEGTFGPHPDIPWIIVDSELVVIVDDRLGTVVYEQAVGTETAASSIRVGPGPDDLLLQRFCQEVGFPHQALICRPADGSSRDITKALISREQLTEAVERAARSSADGRVIVETDLRAHLCPTRRPVIREAADRLAGRLARRCPVCSLPGFGHTTHEPGLPCAMCAMPTGQPIVGVESCPACLHEERHPIGGSADPAVCGYCNP